MKKILALIVLFTLLIPSGMQAAGSGAGAYEYGGGMPGRPVPAQTVPRHEPGRPSPAGSYTTEVSQRNAEGEPETVTLTGLDALLEDGVISDPLQGNYRMVDLDKVLVGRRTSDETNSISTFSAISGTLGTAPEVISGSETLLSGTVHAMDVAAGDLNLDGVDEQVYAWFADFSTLKLSIGEMPGSVGKATSDPAAVVHSDGSGDLLVRGFDQSLWHRHYDGSAWGEWNNDAGGLLISAPAVASPGDGTLDVFAIGVDNQIYRRHWDGSAWAGDWELVDETGPWQILSGMPAPTWPLPSDVEAPAAVTRPGTTQTDLFRRSPDNHLYWRHFDGGAWQSWADLGGIVTSAPAAVSLGADHLQVFARFMDGQMWALLYEGGGWGEWLPLPELAGGWADSTPTAIAQQGAGTMTLYVRVSDGALWSIEHDGTSWGDWSGAAGGSLASAVAAAAWDGSTELFAREADGSLQHNAYDGSGWSGWENWGGLKACCQVTDLPVESLNPNMLSIDTGYFTGDGRAQIVVAFADATGTKHIQVYDIADGFRAALKAEYQLSIDLLFLNKGMQIASGDFDGDAVDEIAVALLSVVFPGFYSLSTYEVNAAPWEISIRSATAKFYARSEDFIVWQDIDRLALTVGDFDGNLVDEIVVETLFRYDIHISLFLEINITGYDLTTQILNGPDLAVLFFTSVSADLRQDGYGILCEGCNTLAAGELDGNPANGEELVRTISIWDSDPPRRMFVLKPGPDEPGAPQPWKLDQRARLDFAAPDMQGWDGIALGDFDRDLVDEIAFMYGADGSATLDVLEYTEDDDSNTGLTRYGRYQTAGTWPWGEGLAPQLVAGSFTGECLRVGPPTYRLQRAVGDILAVINTPPKHKDILDGVTYDVNSADADTYAAYENEQSLSTEMSLQVSRTWGMSAGMEVGVGNPTGTHFKTSMDMTYGVNFENTTTRFSETTFGSEVKAISDDILFYSGKNLELWEYPIYTDGDENPDGRIMVVFPQPLAGAGTQKFYAAGNTTCNFWYAPEHQLNNVWSYAKDASQLVDYDPQKGILNTGDLWPVSTNEGYFYTNWKDSTVTQADSSLNMGVDRMMEAQIGGDAITVEGGINLGIFSIGASTTVYTPYVKGTLKSSYAADILSTHKVSGSDSTTVHVNLGALDSTGYNYEVTPYLYWSRNGYLALDYLTNPLSSTFWDRYSNPDPAFVLPWADGHCSGNDMFSKDITIDPPFASNGERVTVTATVHNFSNVGASNVRVRFCQGSPGAGCEKIGEDQIIPTLYPRARVDVAVEWEANGTGLQRIYAVIDPGKTITEMHDETTNPEMNNNTAFGVLQMGDSGFVDPGGAVYFDYQFLTYTGDQDLRLYVPTDAISETIRYELLPLPPTPAGDNRTTLYGIRLDAYLGGSKEPTPLSFNPEPAVIRLHYNQADIPAPEESLVLYSYDSDLGEWVDAACGAYLRFPEEDWMLVPVCKTGAFAFLKMGSMIYLPLVDR